MYGQGRILNFLSDVVAQLLTSNGNTVTAVSRSLDVVDLYAVGKPDFGDNNWNVFSIPLPIQGYACFEHGPDRNRQCQA